MAWYYLFRSVGSEIALLVLCAVFLLPSLASSDSGKPRKNPWDQVAQEVARLSQQSPALERTALPATVATQQQTLTVSPTTKDQAIQLALKAAHEIAQPLLAAQKHPGRLLRVPAEFSTIQAALDQAKAGDQVVVAAGIYFEQLMMKSGVKLTSERGPQGDEQVAVPGAHLKLPRRALETIIDGSHSPPSQHGMINFPLGADRQTMIDGFTIRNLPLINHHIPSHGHAVNIRGASPTVTNCFIYRNGSTGIGNHTHFFDQQQPMKQRSFAKANVQYPVKSLIYHNIVAHNLGVGIGCNHHATPLLLGNEVFMNDDSALGGKAAPGMGAKHGAQPRVVGNLVHHNPGGGILSRVGAPQGKQPIDQPTRPVVISNVVYDNGSARPALGTSGTGSMAAPVIFARNFIYGRAGLMGIGVIKGATANLRHNEIQLDRTPGMVLYRARLLGLNNNQVWVENGPGLVISHSKVKEMVNNQVKIVGAQNPYLLEQVVWDAGQD